MSGMEEQLTKLKSENCQLQTRLFHIEQIVLPGKVAEIEQLLIQIGNEKLEKVLDEQQCNQARNQIQEDMLTVKNVGKETPELTAKVKSSREEIEKLKTQRNGLLDEVQLLKKDLNDKGIQFDEEIQILEVKLKILQEEKRKFLETSNAVTTLHRQLIETMSVNPESSEEDDGGDAINVNNASVQRKNDKENREDEGKPTVPHRSAKRPRLSSTPSTGRPTTKIGVEFHSVDHSSINVARCICMTTFQSRQTLKIHVQRYGENNLPFACLQCSKRYTSRSAVRKHEKRVHGMHLNDTSNNRGLDDNESRSEMSSSDDE